MSARPRAAPGEATRLALAALALVAACAAPPPPAEAPAPYALVYAEDFAGRGVLEGFTFSDPAAWSWTDEGGVPSLELRGESSYRPPFRSPASLALVPGILVRDFDLEVDLLQTGRDYGHRDLCLFFGFQSASRFYYVHLATTPDPNAHNIFLVDGAPRRNLAEVAAQGVDWGRDQWHRVRVERRVGEGTIRVFWDRGEEPILTATDTMLDWGRLGFGSFDDTGRIAHIRVHAPAARVSSGDRDPFR
ncbi:MAG: hypothetical protein AB1726_01060 [Planctomycetota bacterium]